MLSRRARVVEAYRWGVCSSEDQGTQVCGALVRESTSRVDQGSNTVCLKSGPNERGAPARSSGGSLLGLKELLLAVGSLRAVVGVTEKWCKDSSGGSLVEDNAEGDGRRLDGWEVCSKRND